MWCIYIDLLYLVCKTIMADLRISVALIRKYIVLKFVIQRLTLCVWVTL